MASHCQCGNKERLLRSGIIIIGEVGWVGEVGEVGWVGEIGEVKEVGEIREVREVG